MDAVDDGEAAVAGGDCRDAQLALDDADGSGIIVVVPTSLATSYVHTGHALTAISVDSLSTAVQSQLANELDGPVGTFELIQVGKWNSTSVNHSLGEFTDA